MIAQCTPHCLHDQGIPETRFAVVSKRVGSEPRLRSTNGILISFKRSARRPRTRGCVVITRGQVSILAQGPRTLSTLLTSGSLSSGWWLWACIAACAGASQLIERRTQLGKVVSAPLVATLLGLSAASVGILSPTAPAYGTIWTYIMPLAVSLYLLESDMRSIFSTAGQSLVAFVNGALGAIIGTLCAFALLGHYLGPDGPKVAAALCASYIGGSVNFAAVSGLLGLTAGPVLASAMTADNLAMAGYIAVLMSIPAQLSECNREQYTGVASNDQSTLPEATAETLGVSLAAGGAACALGDFVSKRVGLESGGLAFTALVASGIATARGFLGRHFSIAGAEALGGALMMLFFVSIGATAGTFSSLAGSGWLLAFIIVQLSIQLAVAVGLGAVMRIPLPVVLVAANANVGGPATAAAMAATKGWRGLVQAAVLTGSFGYAIANFIGWGIGKYLMSWNGIA